MKRQGDVGATVLKRSNNRMRLSLGNGDLSTLRRSTFVQVRAGKYIARRIARRLSWLWLPERSGASSDLDCRTLGGPLAEQ